MGVIRKHQHNTPSWHRSRVDDAMSIVGERVVLVNLFNEHRKGSRRCSKCYDDVYGNTASSNIKGHICPECFGSTWEGVHKIHAIDSIVGKPSVSDSNTKQYGVSESIQRTFKTSWPAEAMKGDLVVRLFDHANSRIGVYKVTSDVRYDSIKDGHFTTGVYSNSVSSSFSGHLQDDLHPMYLSARLLSDLIIDSTYDKPFVYIPDRSEIA